MNCIIIDDEELARTLIKDYVSRVGGIDVIHECKSGSEALQWLQENKTDLMFLDINMPGLTGLELLRNIKDKPLVILTTAYSEYALEGFELEVLDYLVKPISFERFLKATMRAKELKENMPVANKDSVEKEDYFFVKADYKQVKINFDDVLFVEGLREYVRIHTKEKKIITLLSMNKLEETLPRHRFLRIHRSYIIQLRRITSVSANEVEIEGHRLPIGGSHKQAFSELMRSKGLFS